MSFVTNNNTRRTKRARVHGTTAHQTKTGGFDHSVKSLETFPSIKTSHNKSNLVVTSIGSFNSKGLQIIGGAAGQDFSSPTNPDDKTIPGAIGGAVDLEDGPANRVADPAFPISFSGPGYMKFQSEVAIPTIRGDVHILGDLHVHGSVTSTGPTAFGILEGGLFIPVITDALGNELDGVTAVSSYVTETTLHYLSVRISWTGKTLIDDTEPMRLTGLPFTTYTDEINLPLSPREGVTTINVGANLYARAVGGNDWLDFIEYSSTSGATATDVLGSQFASSGSLVIAGWLVA